MWASNDIDRRWQNVDLGQFGQPANHSEIYAKARAMRAQAVRDAAKSVIGALRRALAAPTPTAAPAISPLDHPRYRAELQHAEAVANAIVSVTQAIAKLPNTFKSWRQRRRTYVELMSLDERTLADIGITRGEIDQIASGQYIPAPRRAASVPEEAVAVSASNSNKPKMAA